MPERFATELETYSDLWQAVSNYGDFSPGEQYAEVFASIVGDARGTVLDAGCGTGKGGVALAKLGFTVTLVDITPAGLAPEAKDLPWRPGCLWHDLRSGGAFFDHRRQEVTKVSNSQYDWVYCCDVLEHIPTELTMLVAFRLVQATKRGVFLSVSLMPDAFGAWIGKRLHRTVQPFVWWKAALSEVGRVKEARDLLHTALFYLEPQR